MGSQSASVGMPATRTQAALWRTAPRSTKSADAATMLLPLPASAPHSILQHPAAQGLVIDPNPVFFGQMLGAQRRAETLGFAAGILALD
jgi:hypothetical protein